MTLLSLDALGVTRGDRSVLQDVSLTIAAGECIGLIGPNGAGKTTLMRGALGLLPVQGRSSLAQLPAAQRARHAAWLPQQRDIAWALPVETLVALGRIPHGTRQTPADRDAIDQAITRMGLHPLRQRAVTTLSGGEQARALIARALAQDTPLLMADEPISGLDPAAQLDVLALFARLAKEGRSVWVALHDLGLAARFCTRLIVLDNGQIRADGAPADVLTPDLLAEVFQLRAELRDSPHGLIVTPLERLL